MEDMIESFMESRELVIEELTYFEMFPEDDPQGFSRLLAEAEKATDTLDEAYDLARSWQKKAKQNGSKDR